MYNTSYSANGNNRQVQLETKLKDLLCKLPTHIFDEQSMQHDICQTIILQRGEQWRLLEHKHRHHLCRCGRQRGKGPLKWENQ